MAAEPPDTTASKPSAKPANKFDPFRPDMPQIPGVRDAHLRTAGSASRANARRFAQIGGVAAVALVIAAGILWRVNSAPRRAAVSSASETGATETSRPAPAAPVPATTDSEGFTVAATAEELSKPWASKTFTFVNPITHESVNAIVIRLPGGGLWAFSLQEPFGQCELEFVTDLPRLAKQYGYRASHPMVADPCNSTIYDPLKVGTLGGDVWVRGEIVQGGGLRPPIAIDVQVRGNSIIADRIE